MSSHEFNNNSSEVTITIDSDGIYACNFGGSRYDNCLSRQVSVEVTSASTAVISGGGYRLRLDVNDMTLTDINDRTTYKASYR